MEVTQHQKIRRQFPRREAVPVCRCGQDLDVMGWTHCPRCGTTLPHRTAVA
jgi:hypothetical protein